MTFRDPGSGEVVPAGLQRGERGATVRLASSRMSADEVQAVRDRLDERIEGSRMVTSACILRSDWRGRALAADLR
jgi:hypothetical protein